MARTPRRIYLPLESEDYESYWEEVLDPSTITLPQWIEGQARGTMCKMDLFQRLLKPGAAFLTAEAGLFRKITRKRRKPDK